MQSPEMNQKTSKKVLDTRRFGKNSGNYGKPPVDEFESN